MTEAERAIYTLITVGGTVALCYGAVCFMRGRFTILTPVGFRGVSGLWGLTVSMADVLLGVVAIVYGVVGLLAADGEFAAQLNRIFGLPQRGTTLELLNGDTIDMAPAAFYLAWGFWQAVVSLSPLLILRFSPPKNDGCTTIRC